ncbi:hypothetical protein ACFW5X_32750 [Streptomyces albogriseolus]|uniref:hypothetical protein n=1 Tax=Streptomyces TaxID=1883 RepID=UPI001F6215FE|nr:hypothetical protein [Streptomyces sp. MMS20-AI2-20]MCI4146612.1 hypothetical protein [Streptomyces sp. MMS20-AI2-20]
MSQNIKDRDDLMETIASLTAEAVLLEGRVQTLCEELAVVAARTRVITEFLHRLDGPDSQGDSVRVADPADPGGIRGQRPRHPAPHTGGRIRGCGGSGTRRRRAGGE